MKQDTKRSHRATLRRWALLICLAVGISTVLSPQAKAGFLDTYPLTQFTLTNSPSFVLTNGSVKMVGTTIVLTGGNSGSGEAGTTDLLTTAVAAGLIQFDFSYASLDVRQFDSAGYLLNGVFTQLADTDGESGMAQFAVTLGESFGFRVATADNQFEPGILTISSAAANTPEPATGPAALLVLGGILAGAKMFRGGRTSRTERAA
jgi:hypothetical protein